LPSFRLPFQTALALRSICVSPSCYVSYLITVPCSMRSRHRTAFKKHSTCA